MVVHFKDGTRMTLPNGPQATSFMQFDLPWLIYVHGQVTSYDAQQDSPSFAAHVPKTAKSGRCVFC